MKNIIKLTKEYASNLSCLFITTQSLFNEDYAFLQQNFKVCESIVLRDKKQTLSAQDTQNIDIVIVHITDACPWSEKEEMKTLLQSLRDENEILPIYSLHEQLRNRTIEKMLEECYCFDGSIPRPFSKDGMYRFFYRVLKRITIVNDLVSYVATLEEQLLNSIDEVEAVTQKAKAVVHTPQSAKNMKTTTVAHNRRKDDVRFTQNDKISAVEFMNSLDSTIIDKVELLSENLDNFITTLYDFEKFDAENAFELIEGIHENIYDIHEIIDSLAVFNVTARAFDSLGKFLTTVTLELLMDSEKKNLLSTMLLAVIGDLEKWISVVFIEHTTDDIHYFDASFSSNILEIETAFLQIDDEEDDDDDDLEFF